jgi:hypothetical protein
VLSDVRQTEIHTPEQLVSDPSFLRLKLLLIWILEIGCGGMDSAHLAQDRDQWRVLVKMVMNLWVTYNVGKFFSTCTTDGFSRRAHLHGVS